MNIFLTVTTRSFADDDIFPDDNDTVSDVHETEDQFDDEFGIMVANKKEYAEEAKRLKKEEAQINEENKKFAEGKASFQEKLNPWSDLSMKEYLKEKTGVVDPNDGYARGLYLPPGLLSNSLNSVNFFACLKNLMQLSSRAKVNNKI